MTDLKRGAKPRAYSILILIAVPLLLLAFVGFQLAGASEEEAGPLEVTTADLSISKVASSDLVAAGEQLTYSLTINNSGTSTATNVIVSDTLPSGVSVTMSSTSVDGAICNATANPVVCPLGDIAVGASAFITIGATVDPAITGLIVNNAEVSTDSAETNLSNNTASASTTVVASADLSLVKTANSNVIVAGELVTYTLNISNAGPSIATGVEVDDSLPQATTYISATGAPCTKIARTVVCTLPNPMEPGTSTLITMILRINPEVVGTVTNSAVVTSETSDSVPGNNQGSVLVNIDTEADLSLVKTASSGNVVAGDHVTYTLAVNNAGPSNAVNAVISDTLPSGISFVSASGASCSDLGNVIDCSLPSPLIANSGSDVTMVVNVDLAASGILTNYAEVTSDTGDNAQGNNLDTAVVSVAADADLSLLKTASSSNVIAGQRLTYTLAINNAGPSAANGITISDTLPTGTSFVSAAGADCVDVNNLLACSLPGPLAANAGTTIDLVVDVDPGASGTLTNHAEVTSIATGDLPGDNQDSVVVTVTAETDLSLVKTANTSNVNTGQPLIYTLNIGNAGPSSAIGVTISDTLPLGTSFVSASGASCIDTNNLLDCLLAAPLAPNAGVIITVTVDVDLGASGTLTNYAEVNSSSSDNVPENNLDSALVTINDAADLSLTKTANSNSVVAGKQLTYTLLISNAGPSAAVGVIISDTLPQGTSFVSASGASCTDINNVLSCTLPNPLAASANSIVNVLVNVDPSASGILTNYAEVSSNSSDNSPGDNQDSAVVTVTAEADLSLLKTASSNNVIAGEQLTYTLSINNAGPSTATGVTISDTLPQGTSFVSASGANCANINNVLDCTLPNPLAASANANINVLVSVDPSANGIITNYAEVNGNSSDNSPGNNQDSVAVTVAAVADLSLVKTASSSKVLPGARLTYTLSLNNNGPSNASGVTVTDTLPLGISFVSATGATCNDVGNVLRCSLASPLAANAGASIILSVDVDFGTDGTLTNYAEVSSATDDNSLVNNQDSAVTTVAAEADLSLVKTASSNNVVAGERLTYTLTINNAGPSAAVGITVSDTLPLGVSFVSAGGANCTDTNNVLSCALSNPLTAGANAIISILVDVDPAAIGTLTNYAKVISEATDNSPGNNLDSALVTATAQSDLSITKLASIDDVIAGESLTYNLTINNAGPSAATGITVSDTLPSETSLVSVTGANCSNINNVLSCELANPLPPGSNTVINLLVDVNPEASGTFTNYAEVFSNATDNSPGNNLDSAVVTATTQSDLSLIKTASSSTVVAGGRLTYTLSLNNAGPSVATGVTVSDTLPAGTSFLSATGASCTVVNNLLDCALANPLAANSGAVIILVVEVDSAKTGLIFNVAEVRSDADDNSPSDNSDSASTISQLRIFRTYVPFVQQGVPSGEPNNTCQQAYYIAINSYYWFTPNDVFDWYQFDLPFAGNVTVELTNFTPIYGQVAASKGISCADRQQLGNNGAPGTTKILQLGQQAPGHYYLFIGSDGKLSDTVPYRLRVLVVPTP